MSKYFRYMDYLFDFTIVVSFVWLSTSDLNPPHPAVQVFWTFYAIFWSMVAVLLVLHFTIKRYKFNVPLVDSLREIASHRYEVKPQQSRISSFLSSNWTTWNSIPIIALCWAIDQPFLACAQVPVLCFDLAGWYCWEQGIGTWKPTIEGA